jgi:hypothetical protein
MWMKDLHVVPRDNQQYIDDVFGRHVINVRFEVLTAVTMKNVVFWDMKPSSYLTGDTTPLQSSAR